jgi:hypothetical protein
MTIRSKMDILINFKHKMYLPIEEILSEMLLYLLHK